LSSIHKKAADGVHLAAQNLPFLFVLDLLMLVNPIVLVCKRRELASAAAFSKTSREESVKEDILIVTDEVEYLLAIFKSHLVPISAAIVRTLLPKVLGIVLLRKDENAFFTAKGPVLAMDDYKELIKWKTLLKRHTSSMRIKRANCYLIIAYANFQHNSVAKKANIMYIKLHRMSTMVKEPTVKNSLDRAGLRLTVGSLVEGTVASRERSSLFIDLGPEGTGIIFGREFYVAKDVIKNLNIGDVVHAKVVDPENEEGYVELSLKDAAKDMGWQKLKDLKLSEEIIAVKISGVNKGGLLSEINGIPAFLPVSQLSSENYPRVDGADKTKILKELQKFVGKTMEVKVLDVMPEENKLILSEKAKTEQAMKKILENYKIGDTVDGIITGIADFGAFIKFPATTPEGQVQIEGLIHISELDWQLVHNPNEVVKIGDTVKAQIINISNNQVFLSLKRLKENPWQEVEKTHKKGDIVKGKVTGFSAFGAFVEVMPKIRGLCHVSEFASQKEMEETLKVGETYEFEITQLEPAEHRMSLKLKK